MQVSNETQDVNSSNIPAQGMDLISTITSCLDDNKAEDINTIDLNGKSGMADYLVIANGRSARQVGALADYVLKGLKEVGVSDITVEGLNQADWVLIDAGDIIVHLFRPEVRDFYKLDKMWSMDLEEGELAS